MLVKGATGDRCDEMDFSTEIFFFTLTGLLLHENMDCQVILSLLSYL